MRVEYPGAIYHVMDRGDRREDIFVNDVDRQDFLKTLAEACQKTAWQVQEELKPVRRGWCLGSEQFRQEMLERMDGKLGENHSGELHRETAAQKANRILSEELSRRGWTESDLAARRRNDPGKVAIAVRLRNETTLPGKWIAARVQIGTAKGAKSVLHHLARGHHPVKPARADESCAQLEFQSTVWPIFFRHRPPPARFAPESRYFSRLAWPLGRCRPPTLSAMGQNRQKLGIN
ncbi:MAG: hypothetical protein NT154_25130 [Verrucomicrobia bacterium]|nr:hypothetical protein [Verrucomicrobiota bacterium]